MEENSNNSLPKDTWKNLPTEEPERKPKIEFKTDVKAEVEFLEDGPTEFSGDNGAYYIFNVKMKDTEMIIMTSAWTLLKELKYRAPLKGKKLNITKKLVNGKNVFIVEEPESLPDY